MAKDRFFQQDTDFFYLILQNTDLLLIYKDFFLKYKFFWSFMQTFVRSVACLEMSQSSCEVMHGQHFDKVKTNPLGFTRRCLCQQMNTHFEIAIAVIAAGSLLSFLSNAVCMVSLLRNTSCLCQQKPEI